jgi:hypothetical protein
MRISSFIPTRKNITEMVSSRSNVLIAYSAGNYFILVKWLIVLQGGGKSKHFHADNCIAFDALCGGIVLDMSILHDTNGLFRAKNFNIGRSFRNISPVFRRIRFGCSIPVNTIRDGL